MLYLPAICGMFPIYRSREEILLIEIARDLEPIIESWLFKNKIITIYGPRQVGKTTLAKRILKKFGSEKRYFNCEITSNNKVKTGDTTPLS